METGRIHLILSGLYRNTSVMRGSYAKAPGVQPTPPQGGRHEPWERFTCLSLAFCPQQPSQASEKGALQVGLVVPLGAWKPPTTSGKLVFLSGSVLTNFTK